MIKLETVCTRGHVEFVEPGPWGGYYYVGRKVCQRRFPDGTVCASPIVNTFALWDEDERPSPDDSVAPGAAEAIDEQTTLVKQIEEVAGMLLARGAVLNEEDAVLVAEFAARTGVSLPTVTRLIEGATETTGCRISEPHAPGMHAPAIDLEPDEEDGDPDPVSYESGDEEEDEIFGEVGKRIAQRAAAARARISGRERYPALIAAAALASLGLTILFTLQGRWILALLV